MKDNYDISALKKKKKVNSRAKGSTFERQIAKILNDRLGTTEFSRTPGSGAFATTHSLPDHLKIYGDLITPQNFKYTIECKVGYDKENLGGFFKDNSELYKFIEQSKKDSKQSGKPFLVVFKQTRKDILCIIEYCEHVHATLSGWGSDFLVISDNYLCFRLKDLLQFEDSYLLGYDSKKS